LKTCNASAPEKPFNTSRTPLRRGFYLVTKDLPRSRDSVAIGNPPRFARATPFGLHPASVLARLAAGAGVAGFALRPSPLPLGSLASTSIKGAASPTSSPVRTRCARLRCGFRACPWHCFQPWHGPQLTMNAGMKQSKRGGRWW